MDEELNVELETENLFEDYEPTDNEGRIIL